MIKPYAILDPNGLCTNVASWDGVAEWSPPPNYSAIPIDEISPQPGIGWTYLNGSWSPPPPPPEVVPVSVTRAQALAALSDAGLLTKAQAVVTAATDPHVAIFWNNSPTFLRTSPSLIAIGTALGLTSAQIDVLFIAAAKINI